MIPKAEGVIVDTMLTLWNQQKRIPRCLRLFIGNLGLSFVTIKDLEDIEGGRFKKFILSVWGRPPSELQESSALRDIESFCNGRIELGINTRAYKDVLVLVRQHIKAQ